MNVATLRSGLAVAVATVQLPGLKVTEKVPDSVTPPQAVVYRNVVDYDAYEGGDGGGDLNFAVIVYTSRTTENKSQEMLDALVEPTGVTSMKLAIESNAALRALCGWVRVPSAGPVLVTKVGNVDYLTVEFPVEIGV